MEVDATAQAALLPHEMLISTFGASPLDAELLARFERVTGKKPHTLLRRGLFFAHRDFDRFLDAYERGQPVYLYTGRGPSSDSLHLGHLLPFIFTQYLQEAFNCYVVIQVTDDEKFLRDRSLTFDMVSKYARENIRDIIACGFDPEKTFIFINSEYMCRLPVYRFLCAVERMLPINQLRATFGFEDVSNVGYMSFPPKQILPIYSSFFDGLPFTRVPIVTETTSDDASKKKKPNKAHKDASVDAINVLAEIFPEAVKYQKATCLIPAGLEQDLYFRLGRDLATRLGFPKSTQLIGRFLPGLQGAESKMSASDPNNAVYLTDTPKMIKQKINKHAFSGGRDTIEEHRLHGANLDVDVSIKYLEVFLDSDEELERIKTEYKAGRMLTGEVKKILIDILGNLVEGHQARRAAVTDEQIAAFTSISARFE